MRTVRVKLSRKKINDVYIPHLKCDKRIQIFFGGAGSGKSVFLAQRDIVDVLGGHNVLVCRAVARTLKHSVFAEAVKVIADWGLSNEFKINKSDMTITARNGHQILFSGLDDVEKMKSITPDKGVFTRVRIEEATEVTEDDIKQLLLRQRGGSESQAKTLTLSFNPILRSHHIYENYFLPNGWTDSQETFENDELFILRTWYIHNRFLTKQDVKNYEALTGYFRDVYTFGYFGVLGDVIFDNWVVADLSDPDDDFYLPPEQQTNTRNGLDFGFSSDPSAMPLTHYNKSKKLIYIYGELYERGLTNDLLAEEVKKLIGRWFVVDAEENVVDVCAWDEAKSYGDDFQKICKSTDYVVCDSAEPKSISELQQRGVNAVPAKKGKDSVNFGIDWLKQQTIVVDKKCTHAQLELQQYQWKKDRDGNSLKIPVDRNNHLIDGLRYAYENDMVGIDYSKVIDSA